MRWQKKECLECKNNILSEQTVPAEFSLCRPWLYFLPLAQPIPHNDKQKQSTDVPSTGFAGVSLNRWHYCVAGGREASSRGVELAVLSGKLVQEVTKKQKRASAALFILAPNCGTVCSLTPLRLSQLTDGSKGISLFLSAVLSATTYVQTNLCTCASMATLCIWQMVPVKLKRLCLDMCMIPTRC